MSESNGSKRAPRARARPAPAPPDGTVVAELEVPPADGVEVDGVVMPAVLFVRAPDGSIRYALKGISALEAPTLVEIGLGRLRADLGLSRLA
jgi:hypothetical protein